MLTLLLAAALAANVPAYPTSDTTGVADLRSAYRVRAFRLEYAPHRVGAGGDRGFPAGSTADYRIHREIRLSPATSRRIVEVLTTPSLRAVMPGMWCISPPPGVGFAFAFDHWFKPTTWVEYNLPLESVMVRARGRPPMGYALKTDREFQERIIRELAPDLLKDYERAWRGGDPAAGVNAPASVGPAPSTRR